MGVSASHHRPLFARPSLLLLVVAGGAVGTAVRSTIEDRYPHAPGGWPWATFVINVTGSFLLGALVAWLARGGPDEGRRRQARLGLGTGVLGGFTTYSTFVVEADTLLRDGHVGIGLAYAATSVALGVAAAAGGFLLAGHLRRRTAAS
ncbi:fluoride efflux transporter FluC [Cellulomonas composti]|uniref:Fluoride-specific ion channel FluC n=1 Tax=Cellulomonas composti TaxID=266130 RepID=A0A511J9F8_9CELL|nr:CrcB family protein [Cellulomonas composti]GEL94624.1 putative fluoride ion transporter CrcB [Cellulomonas composti]